MSDNWVSCQGRWCSFYTCDLFVRLSSVVLFISPWILQHLPTRHPYRGPRKLSRPVFKLSMLLGEFKFQVPIPSDLQHGDGCFNSTATSGHEMIQRTSLYTFDAVTKKTLAIFRMLFMFFFHVLV